MIGMARVNKPYKNSGNRNFIKRKSSKENQTCIMQNIINETYNESVIMPAY